MLVALLLARRGVDVRVLERAQEVHPLPRAVAADPAVLQALADAGLAATAQGLTVLDGVRLDARPGARRPVLHVHPAGAGVWPGLATYSQPDLEADLRAALGEVAPDALVGGADVVAVRADGRLGDREAVVLRVRPTRGPQDGGAGHPSAGEQHLRARAVVAADGAHSSLRAAAGLRTRRSRGRHRWTVLDLALPEPLERRSLTFTLDPRRPCVDLPVPGGHRVEALLRPDEPDDALSGATRDALLRRLLGDDAVPVGDVTGRGPRLLRAATYTFTTAVAERLRAGPVLLVGDAAHQVPPFLGQGLALGVGDAVGLAWRLAEVLIGGSGAATLDRWDAERRRAALGAAVRSRAAGALLQADGAAPVRDVLLRAAAAAPVVGPWLRAGGPRPPARVHPADPLSPRDLARHAAVALAPRAVRQRGDRSAARVPPDGHGLEDGRGWDGAVVRHRGHRGVGRLLPDVGVRRLPGHLPDPGLLATDRDRPDASGAARTGPGPLPRPAGPPEGGADGSTTRLGEVLGDGWVLLRRPAPDRLRVRVGARAADVLARDAGVHEQHVLPAVGPGAGTAAYPGVPAQEQDVLVAVSPGAARDLDDVVAVGEVALVRPDRVVVAAVAEAPDTVARLQRLAAAHGCSVVSGGGEG